MVGTSAASILALSNLKSGNQSINKRLRRMKSLQRTTILYCRATHYPQESSAVQLIIDNALIITI